MGEAPQKWVEKLLTVKGTEGGQELQIEARASAKAQG